MKELSHEHAQNYLQSPAHLMATERVLLNDHLANCPACQAYADEVRAVQAAASSLLHRRWDGNVPDPSLTRRVMARTQRNKLQKQLFMVAGAIASIAVVLVVFFLIQAPISDNSVNPSGPTAAPILTELPAAHDNASITIGLLAGHNDTSNESGATCGNGTTEAAVTLALATLIQKKLEAQGYSVDLLDEFDARLQGYKASVLITLHTGDCEAASGFSLATYPDVIAESAPLIQTSEQPQWTTRQLDACLLGYYTERTGLNFDPDLQSTELINYHVINEVDSQTLVSILQVGSLGADQDILVKQSDLVATAITDGVICYLNTLQTIAQTSTLGPAQFTIGIIAGPQGEDNSETGAACPDGTNEAAVTLNIANLVKGQLESEGYSIDILDEFEERTIGVNLDSVIVLQTGDCAGTSGALITTPGLYGGSDTNYKTPYLNNCLWEYYSQKTGQSFMRDPKSVNYIFYRYDDDTTIAQILMGNLGGDRKILIEQPEIAASGIADGIRCYVRKITENIVAQVPTVVPVSSNTTISIGILAGYELSKETGETCPDGTTESAVTLNIANLIKNQLETEGYSVEVLDTIVNRMNGEKKAILIVLQTSECEAASGASLMGFAPGGSLYGNISIVTSKESYLTSCLIENYSRQTGIRYLEFGSSRSIGYIFERHNSDTAVAQVTLGSLGADRNVLVEQPDIAATAIANSLKCFLERPATSYSIEDSYSQVLKEPTNPLWHGYLGWLYYNKLDYEKALIELGCAIEGCMTKSDTVDDTLNAPELKVEGLPLTDETLTFYRVYTSVLSALSTPENGYCSHSALLTEQIRAFAPNDEITNQVLDQNEMICQITQSTKVPTKGP